MTGSIELMILVTRVLVDVVSRHQVRDDLVVLETFSQSLVLFYVLYDR